MVTFTAPGKESGGAAFMRELYKKYGRLMYATARRSIPNSQDRKDVVQDATVYIVYNVKSKVINFKRYQTVVNQRVVALEDTNLEELRSPDPTLEALVEQTDTLYRVWRRLPEKDRELFYRKYVLWQYKCKCRYRKSGKP